MYIYIIYYIFSVIKGNMKEMLKSKSRFQGIKTQRRGKVKVQKRQRMTKAECMNTWKYQGEFS